MTDKSAAGQEVIFILKAEEAQMDQQVSLYVFSPRSKSGRFPAYVAFKRVDGRHFSVSS